MKWRNGELPNNDATNGEERNKILVLRSLPAAEYCRLRAPSIRCARLTPENLRRDSRVSSKIPKSVQIENQSIRPRLTV